jgi:hypothetical protein
LAGAEESAWSGGGQSAQKSAMYSGWRQPIKHPSEEAAARQTFAAHKRDFISHASGRKAEPKSANGRPFALVISNRDYPLSSFSVISASRSAMAALRDNRTRPFSSTPRHLTVIPSPTLTMSSVFLTRKLASSLMWTRPSVPGRNSTNAPNSA